MKELSMLRHMSLCKISDLGTFVIANGLHRKARSKVYMVKTDWTATRKTTAETAHGVPGTSDG